jgi:L-2,4-diaminobutyrate decarboxylase
VEANVAIAKYLSRCVAASDDLEQLPESPELSVVCLRHLPRGVPLAPDALDAHQDTLQAALESSGDGWLSTTRLRGSTWLRAGVMNPMTTEADIDRLLTTLRRLDGVLRSP